MRLSRSDGGALKDVKMPVMLEMLVMSVETHVSLMGMLVTFWRSSSTMNSRDDDYRAEY